jgi:hypothetical protein
VAIQAKKLPQLEEILKELEKRLEEQEENPLTFETTEEGGRDS